MPSSRSRRQAGIRRIPEFLAVACARTIPAKELRSVIAISLYPSLAASCTSSCGCDAPRRKEKLLVICSSLYMLTGSSFSTKCVWSTVDGRQSTVHSRRITVHRPLTTDLLPSTFCLQPFTTHHSSLITHHSRKHSM
jgi:hypothetical protein